MVHLSLVNKIHDRYHCEVWCRYSAGIKMVDPMHNHNFVVSE